MMAASVILRSHKWKLKVICKPNNNLIKMAFDIAKLYPSPIYYECGILLSYRYRKD